MAVAGSDVVVTGSPSGTGEAIVERFCEGAHVVTGGTGSGAKPWPSV